MTAIDILLTLLSLRFFRIVVVVYRSNRVNPNFSRVVIKVGLIVTIFHITHVSF